MDGGSQKEALVAQGLSPVKTICKIEVDEEVEFCVRDVAGEFKFDTAGGRGWLSSKGA